MSEARSGTVFPQVAESDADWIPEWLNEPAGDTRGSDDVIPEFEYDDRGRPTPESVAAYDAAVEAIIEADFAEDDQEDDDVLDDEHDVDEPDDTNVIPFPRRPGLPSVAEHVAGTPDAAWIEDYDRRHGLVREPRLTRRARRIARRQQVNATAQASAMRSLGAELAELGHSAGAWFAAESERRRDIRTELLPQVRDAERALRAARRADPERTRAATHTAERTLRQLKNEMPQPFALTVTEALAVLVAAVVVGALRMPVAAWWWTALAGSLTLAAGAGLLLLRARRRRGHLIPTAEERALLRRLDTKHWVRHGEARGLAGTVTGVPTLGEAGIEVAVRLDGKWTPDGLAKAEDNIRALLRARSELKMQVRPGTRGGWATLTLRTRSAADGVSLRWTKESPGIGLDTVTGMPVVLSPFGFRLLAGATGMGKSVTYRPWAADILLNHPNAAVVLVDLKRQEAPLWRGKIRVETEPKAVYGLACELETELMRRQTVSTGTTWTPTPEAPELLVIVDEGAAAVRMSKNKLYKDILDKFEALATMGRAGKIWILWATQYPTKGQGVPPQVVEMMLERIALSVESQQADRVIFGENAADTGWQPSQLSQIPGEALVKAKGRKPNPVQMWHLTDDDVRDLPAGIIWYGGESGDVVDVDFDQEDDDATSTSAPAGPESTETRVWRLVAGAAGPVRQADIAEASGLPKSSLSRTVKKLIESGRLERNDDGTLSAVDVDQTKNA